MDEAEARTLRGQRIKTLLWPEQFETLRVIQASPENASPKWDLGDLTSAAVALVLRHPDASRLLYAQASENYLRRMSAKGGT